MIEPDAARPVWYVVLFSRKYPPGMQQVAERTSIQSTTNIRDVLHYGRTMPKISAPTLQRATVRSGPIGIWNIMALVGPIPTAREASDVYTLWAKNSHTGTINKVARGEAIATHLKLPSYIDWDHVFGVTPEHNTNP